MRARSWLLLTCVLAVGLSIPVEGQEYAGVFAGNGLTLTLSGAGPLGGTVVIEGRRYPVTARVVDGTLAGQYVFDGAPIPFTATLQGDRLVIVSEGESYSLVRTAPAATAKVGATAGSVVEAAPGSGASLADEGWGIRFTVPSGWKGVRGPEGFSLGSDTHKGLIVVFPHEATTLTELSDGAREGFKDDSVQLSMTGTATTFGSTGIAAEFAGTVDGVKARAYAVGLLSGVGSGSVILAIVEAASYGADYQKWVESVASSTSFQKPPVPEAISSWQQDLSGKRLEYLSYYRSTGFSSGSGSTSQNERIILCRDGSFSYRDSSRSSIDTGGASAYSSGTGQGLGRWSVAGTGNAATLVLAFNGGATTYRYRLEMQRGKLHLNGYKYYWSNAGC